MRSCGTSSTYRPPKEWLWPVVKFVNDTLCVPPTLASSWWTLPVKPFGGNHLAIASGSRNARYTLSGVARSTRCRRMVFPGMAFLLSLVTSAYSLDRRHGGSIKKDSQVIEVTDELISAHHSCSR